MSNQKKNYLLLFLLAGIITLCCDDETGKPPAVVLQLSGIKIGPYSLDLNTSSKNNAAPTDKPIVGSFSAALDLATVEKAIQLKSKTSGEVISLTFSYLDNNKTFSALPNQELEPDQTFSLEISDDLRGANKEEFPGISTEFLTVPGILEITSLSIAGSVALNTNRIVNVPAEGATIEIAFSKPVDPSTVTAQNISVNGNNTTVPFTLALSEENKKVTLTLDQKLKDFARYQLVISGQVSGAKKETFQQYPRFFYSGVDAIPDFPLITDDALLTLTQQQTFKYFWDFAHPASGMARERNSSGNIVTTGGSGFGIMSIIVGIERNFITRQQGIERLDKILDFLETADRFHGVWPHWIDGNTGDVIPFSSNDNGGDLVETSFLVEGLLTFRQYLKPADAAEQILINRINTLWQGVEWNWYTRGGQNVLYWHWSPDKEWIMNHQIKGYNEALITYFLAAASPAYTIDASVYHQGWASNGSIKNGKTFYNTVLPLGFDYGGPLFFTHYSFLGLDPRNLSDTYGNYWTQNVNHSVINQAYCAANPRNYVGYSDENWGLTASDNQSGYSAHSPTNDLGVISPTAALSSFPYTPLESMKALKFFYYKLGDRLWGEYGFYDAFNLTEGWTANSYLAIDQGPIVVMIENHRTSLLWNLFMSAPEVQTAKNKLGFQN